MFFIETCLRHDNRVKCAFVTKSIKTKNVKCTSTFVYWYANVQGKSKKATIELQTKMVPSLVQYLFSIIWFCRTDDIHGKKISFCLLVISLHVITAPIVVGSLQGKTRKKKQKCHRNETGRKASPACFDMSKLGETRTFIVLHIAHVCTRYSSFLYIESIQSCFFRSLCVGENMLSHKHFLRRQLNWHSLLLINY